MDRIDELQAEYDRLVGLRGRYLRFYDELPDGDPAKPNIEQGLDWVGKAIVKVEAQIDEVLTDTAPTHEDLRAKRERERREREW